jgi:hypothetical protein
MPAYRIAIQQAPTPRVDKAAPPGNEIGELIRETIRDARQAARDARAEARAQAHGAAKSVKVTVNQRPVIAGEMPSVPSGPSAPGTLVLNRGGFNDNVIPQQAVDISIGFFIMCAVMVIGWPLARAFGRRLERRGAVGEINPAVTSQLVRIEQAVDAMAIEIERISESQRFMAKLQNGAAERGALPSMERR